MPAPPKSTQAIACPRATGRRWRAGQSMRVLRAPRATRMMRTYSVGSLEPHAVVAGVHVDELAGDPARPVGEEEHGRVRHLGGLDVPLEGGPVLHHLEDLAEAGDPAGGERVEGP